MAPRRTQPTQTPNPAICPFGAQRRGPPFPPCPKSTIPLPPKHGDIPAKQHSLPEQPCFPPPAPQSQPPSTSAEPSPWLRPQHEVMSRHADVRMTEGCSQAQAQSWERSSQEGEGLVRQMSVDGAEEEGEGAEGSEAGGGGERTAPGDSEVQAYLGGSTTADMCDAAAAWGGLLGATGMRGVYQPHHGTGSLQQAAQKGCSSDVADAPQQPPRRRQRRALEDGLPTIFEGEAAAAAGRHRGNLSGDLGHLLLGQRPGEVSPDPASSRSMGSPFPSSRSEPGTSSSHVLSQGRLSPAQPLAPQVSPSLAALLSVLSVENDLEQRMSPGVQTELQQTLPNSAYAYRELEVSTSLSALLAILSFETDTDLDSPPSGLGPRLHTSRTLHASRSTPEVSLTDLEMDSSPLRLQRQGSLDSGLKCYQNNNGTLGPSPTGSLNSSPMQSPVRTCTSSLHSTPSPVLTRRLTGNRFSVVRDCWQAGPQRAECSTTGQGLRSVTEVLEEEGTAAFYRGFGADASPAKPSSKRTKR